MIYTILQKTSNLKDIEVLTMKKTKETAKNKES